MHAFQLRGGLIPIPLRHRRIDPNLSVVCDYCRGTTTASLSHILQSCGRTHGQRIDRHNYVFKYAVGVMRQKGFEVLLKPGIRYGQTFRKPDIVAWHSNAEHAFVVDVTVTGDGWEPDDAHLQKADYYSQGEIKKWVKRVSGKATVLFGSATLNWRGAWSPLSMSFLREMGMRLCHHVATHPGRWLGYMAHVGMLTWWWARVSAGRKQIALIGPARVGVRSVVRRGASPPGGAALPAHKR